MYINYIYFKPLAVQHERGPRNSTIRRFIESQRSSSMNRSATLTSSTPTIPPASSGLINVSFPPPPPLSVLPFDPTYIPRIPALPPAPFMFNNVHLPLVSTYHLSAAFTNKTSTIDFKLILFVSFIGSFVNDSN